MEKKRSALIDFIPNFHNRDEFFEKIINEKNTTKKILTYSILLLIFTFCYGIIMGCYNSFLQAISAGIKLPVLFTLTILICFPAFFIIQSILGSKLSLYQLILVILSGFVLIASIIISFAPIVLFFMLTGDNYNFIKLLHVAIFLLGGIFGMKTILEALKFSCEKKNIYPKIGIKVFIFWFLILGFVGAQLSWNLRPFIGNKNQPFELFREQKGNIYQQIFISLGELLTGSSEKQNEGKVTIMNRDKTCVKENKAKDSTIPTDSSEESGITSTGEE